MDEKIDYDEIRERLADQRVAVGPGVACAPCSAMIPENYIFGTTVFHPAGRLCGKRTDAE